MADNESPDLDVNRRDILRITGAGTVVPAIGFATPAAAQNGLDVTVRQVTREEWPEIRIFSTVRDSNGDALANLTKSNFDVTEDGTAQTITSVSQPDASGGAVSTALVLDRSGSMSGSKLADAQTAASQFVDNFQSDDEGLVIGFSSNVNITQRWTRSTSDLKDAINGLSAGGETALYDAIINGVDEAAPRLGRSAVIVLTDGKENNSSSSLQDVIDTAKDAGVSVYTIGLGSDVNDSVLRQIANETGGDYHQAPDSSDLTSIYNSISESIQGEYELTYDTTNPSTDGSTRTVELTATHSGNSGSDTGTYEAPCAPLPTAAFSMSPSSPTVGEEVSFDASASDPNGGQLVSYEWDFNNDGQTDATGETATHSYDTSGTFQARLTVKKQCGARDVTIKEFGVVNEPNLSLSLQSLSESVDPGDTVTFEFEIENTGSASATDPGIQPELWELPDGWVQSSSSPDGGEWTDSPMASDTPFWTKSELTAGEVQTPQLTLQVPSDQASGSYTLQATAWINSFVTGTTNRSKEDEGSASVEVAAQGPLAAALNDYESAYKHLLKGQFKGQGHHEAKLYKKYGDTYATRLIDYWGFKAGQVSEDDVRDSILELGDASLNMVEEEGPVTFRDTDAELLWNFYTDMFGEMDQKQPVEELKAIGAQYYMGTHSNQDSYLTFDQGKTLGEVFGEDWALRDEVPSQIAGDEDLTDAEKDRVAQTLTRKADRLRTRGDRFVESMEKAADELVHQFNDKRGDVQGIRFGSDVDASAASGVSSQAAITGAILLAAIGGLASLAGGYLVGKCTTAAGATQAKGVEFEWVDLSVTLEDNAVQSTFFTGFNLAASIDYLSQQVSSPAADVDTEAAVSAYLSANLFAKGAASGATDTAIEIAELGVKKGFATRSAGEITKLELPDINQATQLSQLDTFINSIKQFLEGLPHIGDWFNFSAPTNGEATGTLEIKNTGGVEFKPAFDIEYGLRNIRNKFGSGYKAGIDGPRRSIIPGETQEFDVIYQVPTDKGFLSGDVEVTLGLSPSGNIPEPGDLVPVSICAVDYLALNADRATDSFKVSESVSIGTIDSGSAAPGTTREYTYTPSTDLNQTTLNLNYRDRNADLLLTDEQGQQVGYDYQSDDIKNEIDGATYSGRDTGRTNNEWISFPANASTRYTIEVHFPANTTNTQEINSKRQTQSKNEDPSQPEQSNSVAATQNQSEESVFELERVEVSDLPPKLSVTPSSFSPSSGISRGESISPRLVISEVHGERTAEDVTLSTDGLTQVDGDAEIGPSNISFDDNGFAVTDSVAVESTISIPEEADIGRYAGKIEITASNAEAKVVSVEIVVGSFSRFDSNDQPGIQFDEVLDTIAAFNNGEPIGGEPVSFQDVLRVISAFNQQG